MVTGCSRKAPPFGSEPTRSQSSCTVLSSYMQQIKSQSGTEQIRTVFQCLDARPDGLSPEKSDPNYMYLIKTVENYLQTEASAKYSAPDLKKYFSPNLALFQASGTRILQYVPDPFLYGEVNSGNFAILQQKANGKINTSILYDASTKHIGSVFEEPDGLLVAAGTDQMVNPYFAFIDGFSVSDGKAGYVPVVPDYTDAHWKITPDNGWVRGISGKNTGSSIWSASASSITVQSTDQNKISLVYDKSKRKYSVSR